MPQIIVLADAPAADGEPPIMLRERVTIGDFESGHFAGQLVERLGWAVGDADEHDRHAGRLTERQARERFVDVAQQELRARAATQRRSARLVTTAS